MKAKKYLEELNVADWSKKTVIIDIDGTLVMDGKSDIKYAVAEKVREINRANNVFLFSNKKLPRRDEALQKELQIPFLKSIFRKPNKKIIDTLPSHLKNDLTIIGDKILTDGLFAKNIKADFIKVKRLTNKEDNIPTRLSYLIDNIAESFIN